VAFQQDPDCLSTHAGDQFALDRLLDHQANRPTRAALGRITAHHRDDALLLGTVENLFGSGPRLLIQGAIQAAPIIAMGHLADRFGSQRDGLGDLRSRNPTRQQPQSQRPQNHPHLLNSTS